jgi:hypothetical protein
VVAEAFRVGTTVDGRKKRKTRRVRRVAPVNGAMERKKEGEKVSRLELIREAIEGAKRLVNDPGAEMLEEAADAVVLENCDRLARVLMDGALAGDLGCAKLLQEMANRRRERKKAERLGNAPWIVARVLEREPWRDPKEVEKSMMAPGGYRD